MTQRSPGAIARGIAILAALLLGIGGEALEPSFWQRQRSISSTVWPTSSSGTSRRRWVRSWSRPSQSELGFGS